MNYYDNLNKVIDTIEKELTNEIDYNKLAKIVGISSYSCHKETKKVVCYLNLAKCRCGQQYY